MSENKKYSFIESYGRKPVHYDFTIEQLSKYLGSMSESQVNDLEEWENQNDASREKKLNILLDILDR